MNKSTKDETISLKQRLLLSTHTRRLLYIPLPSLLSLCVSAVVKGLNLNPETLLPYLPIGIVDLLTEEYIEQRFRGRIFPNFRFSFDQ